MFSEFSMLNLICLIWCLTFTASLPINTEKSERLNNLELCINSGCPSISTPLKVLNPHIDRISHPKASIHDHDSSLDERTQSPGGLFGDNNVPDLADIDQTSMADCGLISVLGALIGHDDRYITELVQYTGEAADTTFAIFNLHQPGYSLTPIPQVVEKASLTAVRSDAHEGWWVGGVEQAVRQAGYEPEMTPSRALEMLTGRHATYLFAATGRNPPLTSWSKEDVWTLVQAYADKTPMIVQSEQTARFLNINHAFYITSVYVTSNRWIMLWNPHGEDEVHDFDLIWEDIYALYHFSDLAEWEA